MIWSGLRPGGPTPPLPPPLFLSPPPPPPPPPLPSPSPLSLSPPPPPHADEVSAFRSLIASDERASEAILPTGAGLLLAVESKP